MNTLVAYDDVTNVILRDPKTEVLMLWFCHVAFVEDAAVNTCPAIRAVALLTVTVPITVF